MDLEFLEQQAFPTSDFEEIYDIKTACNFIIINKLIYQTKYFINEFMPCPSMGPNHFGRVPFLLDAPNLFLLGLNLRKQSKKVYFEPDL